MAFNGEYVCLQYVSFSSLNVRVPKSGCGGWHTQWSYIRHEQPWGKPCPSLPNFFFFLHYSICVSLRYAFCLNLFAHSCEHAFFFFLLEGEVKERRLLMMQLITELTATVSCLVCSKSSDTPLGKMRGLITVKLANEQVNYRTKFLYKKCHFSERCSRSCSKSLKKKGGRGWGKRKGSGWMPFYSFLFQKISPVSAPF